MTVIIFIIVLLILIFVHELGHFLAAKALGIRVDEFALGFPPKIWSKKIGETEYSLNIVPFGGFVKIFGENPDEESLNGLDKDRSMVNKPRWAQAIVLVAGVFFNFVFAWILICSSFFFGVSASKSDYLKYDKYLEDKGIIVVSINKDSPAEISGLRPGDNIKSLSTKDFSITNENELTIENIRNAIDKSQGAPIVINFERGDISSSTSIVATDKIIDHRYAIGITMEEAVTLSLPIHLAIIEGSKFTVHMLGAITLGLLDFIKDAFTGQANFEAVAGPVGIAGLVGDAYDLGFVYLIMFTALISINLGVINLLPFPALDGGRLIFVIIESITRRKIKPNIANIINGVGFIILIILMLIVSYRDIIKLF